MSTFVLIHGSGHGGWCWDKVTPLLTQAGHEVIAPDLPGHGNDKTPVREVSLQSCVDRVVEILHTRSEPVILVGHSTGGLTITQTAEQRLSMVRALVYLSAFLLQNGERCVDIKDPESLARGNLVLSKDGGNEWVKEVFYNDCSEKDIARAQSLLVPAPLQIAFTPVATSENNFGLVPRYYIECLRDRAITHPCQRRMYMALPCERVFTLDTSHSPFLSAPQALVDHLLAI